MNNGFSHPVPPARGSQLPGVTAMEPPADQPVFNPSERAAFASDASIAPYTNILRSQLAGLLVAIGEYAIRVGVTEEQAELVLHTMPGVRRDDGSRAVLVAFFCGVRRTIDALLIDAETVQAHSALLDFFLHARDFAAGPPDDPFVFADREREYLVRRKYIWDGANLGTRGLADLLRIVDRYSVRAPSMMQVFGRDELVVRLTHAHNALVAFRERPFTLEEFSASVRAVLSGELSRIARDPGRPRLDLAARVR